QFQDVSFTAIEITPDGGLKSTAEFDCVDNTPNYAHFTIAGITDPFDAALFELDGVLYTQAIKLPVQTDDYCVTQFFLYDDVNDNGEFDDGVDVIVYATPNDGSHYGAYVTNGIEYCFPVTAFTKAQLEIEVLCFEEADYTDFGFDWFAVTEIVVRQFCFFGDICITDENAAAFAGSIYAADGLDPDEEAVFRVIVKDGDDEVPYSPFDNEDIYGQGKALCVDYPDNLSEVNNFTFELQVWQPDGNGGFYWQTYTTFTSTDAGNLFYGTEDLGDNTNVTSFAVGDCSPDSYPIFTWLPAPPPPTNWETFYIRNTNGSITAPWDSDIVLTENAGGDGFSAATPQGGQKVGYGTSAFDGVKVNTIEQVNFDKLSGSPNAPIPYLNFWVTDGVNYAVIACGATDYRAQNLLILNEWPVYEYNTAVDLDWLFDAGDGSAGPNWSGHQLLLNGVPATLGDLGNDIVLFAGPDYSSPGIGTGAPRGGFGFNIIFGDTQSNYIGSYQIGNLSVTIDGVTYPATN
ncbi:MAG TPA: hypothetical protein VIN10_05490, partial [Bacteroidales bacterium]